MRILRETFPLSDIFICPIYTSETGADFQPAWYAGAIEIVKRDKLKVYPVDNGTHGMNRYGDRLEWSKSSYDAAAILKRIMKAADSVLSISIDTPFIELVHLLGSKKQVSHLHIPQSTGILHDPINHARLQLESKILSHIPDNTKIGAIGDFMFYHLKHEYGLVDDKIIFMRNGCLSEDNITLSANDQKSLAKKWLIDEDDREIIASYGRSIRYKGFHTLVEAMRHLPRDKYRLVINATTDNKDSEAYKEHLINTASHMSIDLTLHGVFDPLFPVYIRRHPRTLALVVPSIHEPFGLIPSETMYDPATRAVVISSDADGLGPQLINEQTGFLFNVGSVDGLSKALEEASRLSEGQKIAMILYAHSNATRDFDLRQNFKMGIEEMK